MEAVMIILVAGIVVGGTAILMLYGWCCVLSSRINVLSQRINLHVNNALVLEE